MSQQPMELDELTPPMDSFAFSGQLSEILEMMRAISVHDDPDDVFREYATRIRQIYPVDKAVMLTLTDEDAGDVKAAMMDDWENPIHPWGNTHRFHPLTSGILKRLCLDGQPAIINDLDPVVDEGDLPYLHEIGSLRAIPLFENGVARHMIVGLKYGRNGFSQEELPALVWLSNLFGRAIQNLILARQLKKAYESVDRELKTVGDIQRNLLPEEIPRVPTLELATYYETSQRAGGDYYDFFPLPNGKVGIFIADVSGHGTPAAVVMSIMHTIAHTYTGSHEPPSEFLNHLNQHLSQRFTAKSGIFVTGFYAIYDPQTRQITYSSAGHNPPLRRRCGEANVSTLDGAGRMPLGIAEDITYIDATEQLSPGDRVVLYTDGIVEAHGLDDSLFGVDRLGAIVGRCDLTTTTIVEAVVKQLEKFSGQKRQADDCTLVVMKVH
ncbi:PP2C family protein-serine/threonine phosphatase [Rubinisphaera margarita]|uniref:PP2C family protein-serine/threonine phosphatase n=1 Tax=Rubinisphaera margarita TaxID=2909586 RepID=UPI001EE85896|nr:SpoIIE family protein phosphatase [Rubinisphaera margarita]MCG6155211.1 SpoIIE family protein phosphatase [Rubinisphaera margarita]